MNNIVVLPLLIPLVTAIILLFFYKYIQLQRWISLVSALLGVIISGIIVQQVSEQGIQSLNMGSWLPPYGIVFVADMLAALLVLMTAIIALICLLYAFRSIGEEREKQHFYPFVFFLLSGVSGSFLTGDLFNLFVCFEVMLIASYALIVLGGTKRQLRETLKYILINIVSSTLFVASVAYLYAVTGTLNMAHLAERVAQAEQGGILTVIAIMFLLVFALKAALFLFYWLPGSYGAPPAVIAALFGGLLTKVGIYAIVRTFTLIFSHHPEVTHTLIAWMAAGTMILGGIGAVAYKDIGRILGYNVIAGVGFIVFGLAAATREALEGAVFYLLHDMAVKTLLFLLCGVVMAVAGSDRLSQMGGLIRRHPLLGWMFFISALALVGVPPLSGFVGKLLIVEGGFDAGLYVIGAIGLLLSLVLLYSLMKIFMHAFWGEDQQEGQAESDWPQARYLTAACIPMFILIVMMGVGGEWVMHYVRQAGEVLMDATVYIQAVLK